MLRLNLWLAVATKRVSLIGLVTYTNKDNTKNCKVRIMAYGCDNKSKRYRVRGDVGVGAKVTKRETEDFNSNPTLNSTLALTLALDPNYQWFGRRVLFRVGYD